MVNKNIRKTYVKKKKKNIQFLFYLKYICTYLDFYSQHMKQGIMKISLCLSKSVWLLTLKHVKVNVCLIDTHYIGILENVSHLSI